MFLFSIIVLWILFLKLLVFFIDYIPIQLFSKNLVDIYMFFVDYLVSLFVIFMFSPFTKVHQTIAKSIPQGVSPLH